MRKRRIPAVLLAGCMLFGQTAWAADTDAQGEEARAEAAAEEETNAQTVPEGQEKTEAQAVLEGKEETETPAVPAFSYLAQIFHTASFYNIAVNVSGTVIPFTPSDLTQKAFYSHRRHPLHINIIRRQFLG